jgi:hypothetical protein
MKLKKPDAKTLYTISDPVYIGETTLREDLFDTPFNISLPETKACWYWSEERGDFIRIDENGVDTGKTATEIRQEDAPCSCPVPFDICAETIHSRDCVLRKKAISRPDRAQ